MRWFSFSIVALGLMVLQASLGRLFGLGPQRIAPDLLLLLAMVLTFRIGTGHSLLACWILGMAKDISGGAVLGCYGSGFALAGFFMICLREWFYVEHPLAIMVVVLLGSLIVEQWAFAVEWIKGLCVLADYQGFCIEMFFSAFFTAALAPYGQWGAAKCSRFLGVEFGKRYA